MARKPRIEPITVVSDFVKEIAKEDRAAALAFFLQEVSGSICGQWIGRMSAADQRALFGRTIGRGRLIIDGATETVSMYVSVCFGTDSSCEYAQPWYAIAAGETSRAIELGHIANR